MSRQSRRQQHRPSLTVLSNHAFNMDDLATDDLYDESPNGIHTPSSSPSIKVPTTKRKSVYLDDSSQSLSPRTSLRLSSSGSTPNGVSSTSTFESVDTTDTSQSYDGPVISSPVIIMDENSSSLLSPSSSTPSNGMPRRGSFQSNADFRKEMNLAIDQFPFPPTDPPTSKRQRSQGKGVLRAFKKRS